MDKKPYYISVNTNEIMDDPTAFTYQFEILASQDDIDKLQELFEDTAEAEQASAWGALTLTSNLEEEYERDYDYNLQQVYAMLHELGTPETRRHIESMNILPPDSVTEAEPHQDAPLSSEQARPHRDAALLPEYAQPHRDAIVSSEHAEPHRDAPVSSEHAKPHPDAFTIPKQAEPHRDAAASSE
ncbi:hypothetical protein J31TS4_12110 [Paenibacillus sp. J31TS4]|uniref:hypothetical protein n=1 Tax=Paenibacillus sp. J31TS4 TaxID=2807195 RepID=UPI001B240A74|nr:hypothetical protein [Paenibacillus sp. J31TS4]GIP37931.1 hypothetical protein J31TS4_12110 [Paenibacillus sp. J31TS4]